MPCLLKNHDGNGEGRWGVLCSGDSKLSEDFVAAWEHVRDAAGRPDTGPLADAAESAGSRFLDKEAMRWGGEYASAPGPEDPEDKVKEQKQITTVIEDHIDSQLRAEFAELGREDMRRVAMFAVGPTSRQDASQRRAAAFLDQRVGLGDKARRRLQGLLPDRTSSCRRPT